VASRFLVTITILSVMFQLPNADNMGIEIP
jgi:hypothetical protein